MTTPTTWHYSKLADGTWGAQAFGRLGRKSTWKAGQAVTVTARDGQAQTRTVASLELWQPYASGTKCVLRLEVDAEIAAAAARKEEERTQVRQAERRARDQQRQAAREADAQRKAHRVHVVAGRVQIGDLLMSGGWPQHPMRVTSLGQPFTKQLTTWQYAYGERAPEGEAADLAALERHTWQLRQPADGVRTVPCRAGALVVGQTFRWRDDVLTVAELGRRWFQEDLMSLGRAYGEGTEARHNNEGWRQDAVCRPATADSAGPLEAQEVRHPGGGNRPAAGAPRPVCGRGRGRCGHRRTAGPCRYGAILAEPAPQPLRGRGVSAGDCGRAAVARAAQHRGRRQLGSQ